MTPVFVPRTCLVFPVAKQTESDHIHLSKPEMGIHGKEGSAMMIALEIFGAVAAALTIFSAGVAVGRFIEHKNDRH